MTEEGEKFGYVVKPSKSWLILRNQHDLNKAMELFEDMPIKITTEGKRHLGAALGSTDFKIFYIEEKVAEWCNRLKKLSTIAKSQPQAAYTGYTQGEQHKYTYFLRTVPNIADLMKPLDEVIENQFLPSLFGTTISPNERDILSLPISEGGLGIRSLSETSNTTYDSSRKITAPLRKKIVEQSQELPDRDDVIKAKSVTLSTQKALASNKQSLLIHKQTTEMKRNLEQLSQPGASSWIGAIPLKDQGFNLNKSEFNDALCLRYNKPLKNLPTKCTCGKPFSITHAMNCHRGGFINARHDSIRNMEARLLKEVCNDVQVEPPLQSCAGARFHASANVNDDARLDVRARGFWREGQQAFFDIRVTNADCASQKDKSLKSILRTHEQEKKRSYNIRVMDTEQGTFTPIVLTIKGVMGPEANAFHKTLADKISQKTGERYDQVIRLMRVKLSFLVLRASLLYLRGSRAMYNTNGEMCEDYALTLNEIGLR